MAIPQFSTQLWKGRQRFKGPDQHCYPDPTGRARRVIEYISSLHLWEGEHAGQPFRLLPFQEAVIRRIYGPTAQDGTPLIRTAAIWIARGNAKTALGAALALAHFDGPEAVEGGQVILAAADRENAGIAFGHCYQMERGKDLPKHVMRPQVTQKKLIHHPSNSRLMAISSEAYSKHGLNASFFLADEIHAWAPAEARPLFKVVTDSMVKRSNPLTIIISVVGSGQGGLAWDWWDYSLKVARGEIDDPTFAPIIFAAEPDTDWKDEAAWPIANPGLEHGLVSAKELRGKAKRIEHFPAEIADFKRYHLNLWQEGAAEPWIAIERYDQQDARTPVEELEGQACWVGIDLSSVEDLTAVVAAFTSGNEDNRAYDLLAAFFLPADNLARKSEQDRANYLRWAEQGFLKLTPGNVVDHEAIVDHAMTLGESYDVRELVIDRWNSTAISTKLQQEGFTVIQFGQGFASMAAPVKELKRCILKGQFRHGGNPLLRLCFANVVAEKDAAENEKFTKERATGRIDGAVAAAMAVGRIIAADLPARSIYDNVAERPEGLLVL